MKEPGYEYYYGTRKDNQTELTVEPPAACLLTFENYPLTKREALARLSTLKPSPRIPLGFDPKVIRPAQLQSVLAKPQMAFKGQMLVIPNALATDLLIYDLKVGNVSALASGDPIPAESFGKDELTSAELIESYRNFSMWDIPVCYPGQSIVLTVQNRTGKDIVFLATIFGIAEI